MLSLMGLGRGRRRERARHCGNRTLVLTVAAATAAALATCGTTGQDGAEAEPEEVERSAVGGAADEGAGLSAPASLSVEGLPSRVDAWRTAIPPDPHLDPESEDISEYLGSGPISANVIKYGIPVYEVDSSTPRLEVDCLMDWGDCALEQGGVPVPVDASPSEGTDSAMAVVDLEAGLSYEFWQAERSDGSWVTSWGDVADMDPSAPSVSQATGAGLSLVDGLVTPEQVAAGEISHALTFSTNNACEGRFREPASKTDGKSTREDCVEQGSRIQLDPDVDLDQLELTQLERVVGTALQTYGAYARDNGGTPVAFIFETPAPGDTRYTDAGLGSDYDRLDGIPWDRLRVLERWNGS